MKVANIDGIPFISLIHLHIVSLSDRVKTKQNIQKVMTVNVYKTETEEKNFVNNGKLLVTFKDF